VEASTLFHHQARSTIIQRALLNCDSHHLPTKVLKFGPSKQEACQSRHVIFPLLTSQAHHDAVLGTRISNHFFRPTSLRVQGLLQPRQRQRFHGVFGAKLGLSREAGTEPEVSEVPQPVGFSAVDATDSELPCMR